MKYKDIVLPDYDNCILETINSILKHFSVNVEHKTSNKIDALLNEREYKNIVLLILDGLGECNLDNISPNGYFKQHQIDVVTSVYPSTTTAALTTYYSGKPPIETGWIGWSQYFKEYGRAIDMFSHNESYYREPIKEPLIDVFKTVVNYKTIFEIIEENSPDIKTFEIEPSYAEIRSNNRIEANNIEEIVENINKLCVLPDRKFIFAYSDNPDGIFHNTGTTSEESKKYVLDTEECIKKMCDNLEDTILIISADHGHKDIDKVYSITDYPELQECLILPPSLESRVLSFWVKEDMKKVFEKRFYKLFDKEFWLMEKKDFLEKYHFLGYGKKHPKIDDFIGNYIALSVSSSIIRLETFLTEGKPVKKSTHCGLSKEEMLVPIIVIN